MSLEFENMDDFEPEKTQSMELEEYGVWVKKETPEIVDNILSDDDIFNPDYFQEMIENSPQEQETEIVEKTVDNLVDIPTDSPVLNNLETDNPEIPDIPAESTDTILDEISSDAQVNANDFDIENLASEIDGLDLSAFENQFEEKVIDAKNDEIKDNQEFIEETKNKSFDELPAGFDIPDLSNLTEEIDLSSFMSDFEASIPTPTPKPSSGGTEEVSLDDFGIDFSNSEFVSLDDFITPTEEKNDIIGDEPLDIQLTFDDNYALSTGANPLDEMETEFTEGFLPTGDDILDNFDDIFENVTDIAEPEIKVEETVSDFTTSETVEFDSVSEFDDLLASLSETSESSENIVEKQKENTETYQYDISVNLEEDEIIQDSTPEIDDNEEDFNVSLFSDEEFDNITSTQSANKIQGENTVEVSPMTNNNDSFFSIDDLDDSISFVDETPMDIDGIPVIDETPISDSPSNIEDSDILADDIGLPPLDDNFFASTEELSEPIFPIETTFFDGDNPVFAEEEVVQETEPVFTEEVATQTDDVFAMDDAFVSEPAFAEEEAVEETEPTFTEEVATQTDDAFAMDDAFVSEPAFAEEEAVQETEPTFTEEVATQTDDAFAMDDAFVSEPVFAEEEAVQETEPVFVDEVATQTDDAFAMNDTFVSEPTFAEEEPVQETEPVFAEEEVVQETEPVFVDEVATQTDDAFVSEPAFAEEEVVQETEPTFTEEVATQTNDVFAMDDAFVSEPVFAEEEAVQETEPVFTEEVATQTDDAFAMDDAFVSEPAFTEEEAVQETEQTFTEEVATQTDDAFAIDETFVSEPAFAEEEAVQETEPVFTEEVATQTDDAFAMDDAFVSEPTFAEEEPVQETEPAFTEEDDPFAVDEEQEVNESFLEEDVLEEEKDFAIEEALPTVASITAAALLAGATINSVSPFQNEYEMDTTENVDKTPEMEYNESISPKEDTESMNENETSIDNMGNSLLEKIVNELSELRSEMASLKQELNTIKSTSEEQEKQVEEEIISIPESQSTGFFADDGEDETIALSGDELNNILNSADFTEEIVDESTVQEEITPESNISETEEMIENEVIENEITEESDSEEIAIEEEDLISDDLSIDDSIIEENTIESQIEIQDADINQENEEIIIENDDDDEIQPDEILSVTDETFYDDDNSPALDISNEEIVEPELCNINFEDETENDIPQELPEEELADDFVVDSSTTDFLEENSTNSTDVVQEEMELVEDGNIEEKVAEVENDDILNALDEEDDFNDEPATEVFNSQWDSLDISSEDETDSQENDNPIAITMEELANARMLAENQENEPVAPVVSEEVVSEKPASTVDNLSEDLKQDVKSVLEYMDKLLINLPEEKIKEFAASDHFEVYRKLFSELGLE